MDPTVADPGGLARAESRRSGAWGWRRRSVLLAGVGLCGLVIFWWFAPNHALERWLEQQRAQGERFTLAELGEETADTLPNPAADALEALGHPMARLAGLPSARHAPTNAPLAPGTRQVAWREPVCLAAWGSPVAWDDLEREVSLLGGPFAELRELLKAPPQTTGGAYSNFTKGANFVQMRRVAQGLHGAVLAQLHAGQNAAACSNLVALVRMGHVLEETYTLVSQMIRVAMLGLAVDAAWEFLQTPDLREEELAVLGAALAGPTIYPELVRTMEVERAVSLALLRAMQRKDQDWHQLVSRPASGPQPWNERLFFRVWRRLWSQADGLAFLQAEQVWIDGLRRLANGESYVPVRAMYEAQRAELERRYSGWLGQRYWFTSTALANVARAAQTAVATETRRRLALLAVALERFRLRHGRYPERLLELVPEWLAALPSDPCSGGAFGYRREGERMRLYSVGFDGRDDGGEPQPRLGTGTALGELPGWEGRDFVWPAAAPPTVR